MDVDSFVVFLFSIDLVDERFMFWSGLGSSVVLGVNLFLVEKCYIEGYIEFF